MTFIAWLCLTAFCCFLLGMCAGLYIGMNSVQDVDPNWDTDYASERTLCDLNYRKLGSWKAWSDQVSSEIDLDGVYRGPVPAPTARPLPRPAPPSPPRGG